MWSDRNPGRMHGQAGCARELAGQYGGGIRGLDGLGDSFVRAHAELTNALTLLQVPDHYGVETRVGRVQGRQEECALQAVGADVGASAMAQAGQRSESCEERNSSGVAKPTCTHQLVPAHPCGLAGFPSTAAPSHSHLSRTPSAHLMVSNPHRDMEAAWKAGLRGYEEG